MVATVTVDFITYNNANHCCAVREQKIGLCLSETMRCRRLKIFSYNLLHIICIRITYISLILLTKSKDLFCKAFLLFIQILAKKKESYQLHSTKNDRW